MFIQVYLTLKKADLTVFSFCCFLLNKTINFSGLSIHIFSFYNLFLQTLFFVHCPTPESANYSLKITTQNAKF